MKPDGQFRVSCYAFLVEDGRVLLCRMSSSTQWHGEWTLPGGGMHLGEEPEQAMIREVLEETGLNVEPTGLFLVNSFTSETDPSKQNIRIVYQARILGGELTHEVDGSTEVPEWIPLEKLGELPLVSLALSAVERWRVVTKPA